MSPYVLLLLWGKNEMNGNSKNLIILLWKVKFKKSIFWNLKRLNGLNLLKLYPNVYIGLDCPQLDRLDLVVPQNGVFKITGGSSK